MSPSLPKRQHAVDSASDPPPRMPAGDAFTTVIMQVIRLIRDFTAAGEALARPAGQTLARVLVRDGYAAYEENPAHRRAKLLRVSAPGHTALRAIQTAQRAWSDALGAEVGEADLRRASVVLDRVSAALGSRSPDEFTQPGT